MREKEKEKKKRRERRSTSAKIAGIRVSPVPMATVNIMESSHERKRTCGEGKGEQGSKEMEEMHEGKCKETDKKEEET